jgi:hypothetical protein
MDTLRWFLSIVSIGCFAVCMTVLTGLAIRRLRTGISASGLSFVGSFAAFAGVLILPVGNVATRLPYAFLPFVLESGYFFFNLFMDRKTTVQNKSESDDIRGAS